MPYRSNVASIRDVVVAPEPSEDRAPIQTLYEGGYDEATVDFSEPEALTITQTDEHGQEHILVLSYTQVRQLIPALLRWQT